MSFETIAILSPGNMGSGIGMFLAQNGYEVVTNLTGRSDFTKDRATERGFRDAGSVEGVVERADLVMSVLDPARAVEIAEQVAAAMKAAGKKLVDCLNDAGICFVGGIFPGLINDRKLCDKGCIIKKYPVGQPGII